MPIQECLLFQGGFHAPTQALTGYPGRIALPGYETNILNILNTLVITVLWRCNSRWGCSRKDYSKRRAPSIKEGGVDSIAAKCYQRAFMSCALWCQGAAWVTQPA